MEKKVSVIVPIHNAEKYLKQCINSIVEQTYKNLEIILVNDCSTDSSSNICDEYAEKDNRIRVLHKTTKGGEGGAVARNEGIDAASGDVYYFMDSDDYIEPDMLENMLTIMDSENSECVVTSFHYVDETGEELSWYVPKLDTYSSMSGKEAARIFLETKNIEGFSWNKLLSKRIIVEEKIRFDESMNSFVDMYGMFRAILCSARVSFYSAKPYYYRQLDTSCVHTMTLRKIGNFDRVLKQIYELSKRYDLTTEAEKFYRYRMCMQLYDAVKVKQSYSQDEWMIIKNEFSWKRCMEITLKAFLKEIKMSSEKNLIKEMIKSIIVYYHFK